MSDFLIQNERIALLTSEPFVSVFAFEIFDFKNCSIVYEALLQNKLMTKTSLHK